MSDGNVFYGYVEVYDGENVKEEDRYFTKERIAEWEESLVVAYKDVFSRLKNQLSPNSPISFNISYSLLHEAAIDAAIGLRKITGSTNNSVDKPNAFKIAAYLSYWWLRHQPISLHSPQKFKLDDAELSDVFLKGKTDEQKIEANNIFRWRLKHINEIVAVQFVTTYIFQFDKVSCGRIQEVWVKASQKDEFEFKSFLHMQREMINKLTYYFAYRAIAPKVIEQILESYTFHPAWRLTGNLWSGDEHA